MGGVNDTSSSGMYKGGYVNDISAAGVEGGGGGGGRIYFIRKCDKYIKSWKREVTL